MSMLDESIVTKKMVYGKGKHLETFGNEKLGDVKGCWKFGVDST